MRQMLELAALAAWVTDEERLGLCRAWSPHLDDGESRRLEVALLIDIYWWEGSVKACHDLGPRYYEHVEPLGIDPAAAARMAVLHVAAQMGAAMKEKDE